MPQRTYSVYFAKPTVGERGEPLSQHLQAIVDRFGPNLPPSVIENERFQFRTLRLVGTVWQGTFAKLRDDAPNYVDHQDEERELALGDGASIIEKCQFLYRAQNNVLVWQVSRSAGSITKAASYLSAVMNAVVSFPHVQNNAQLEEMLNNNLYEIDFAYARPPNLPAEVTPWSQRAFDITGGVDAAYAKFILRAGRGRTLADRAKGYVREMINGGSYKRIKIRLTEDSDPVKLFIAPLKEEFTIDVIGRYPRPDNIFQGLEDAYGRQQEHIRANAG